MIESEISFMKQSLNLSKIVCKFSWYGITIDYSISYLTYVIEKQFNYDVDMGKDILRLIWSGFSLRQTLSEMYIIRLTILNKMDANDHINEAIAWNFVFQRITSVVENPMCIIEEYEKEIVMITKNISECLHLPIAEEVNEHMYDHYSMEKINKVHKSNEKFYSKFGKTCQGLLLVKNIIRLSYHCLLLYLYFYKCVLSRKILHFFRSCFAK